jgi:hypothetical protein
MALTFSKKATPNFCPKAWDFSIQPPIGGMVCPTAVFCLFFFITRMSVRSALPLAATASTADEMVGAQRQEERLEGIGPHAVKWASYIEKRHREVFGWRWLSLV